MSEPPKSALWQTEHPPKITLAWKNAAAVLACDTPGAPDQMLRTFAAAGGIDPQKDLAGLDLRGWPLGGQDVRGFNFRNCDLRGTGIESAIVDATTNFVGATRDRDAAIDTSIPDDVEDRVRALISAGDPVPSHWKPHVIKLDVSQLDLVSLDPIAGLANLETLNCSYTEVASLDPIAGLTNLQNLYCSHTQVASLDPVAGLANLQNLYCSNTQVASLGPVAGLARLKNLNCSRTQVASLDSVAGLANLQTLRCSNTPVASLMRVTHLGSLTIRVESAARAKALRATRAPIRGRRVKCWSSR